jgi:4-hydroxybenzoate polyprenyltransferase
MLVQLLLEMRPKQWTKNSIIFFGLVFSFNLFRPQHAVRAVAAFVLFCLLSSAIYIINDLSDIEKDRKHPRKKNRPLASGRLKPLPAKVAAAVFLIGGLAASFALSLGFGLSAVAYVGLNLAYSYGLKNVAIIDVFALSGGFVLRAMAGALAIDVPISAWLYVTTLLGALFLALSKRRHELVLLNNGASIHRPVLEEYTPELLDEMIAVVTASIVMAYSLYTFSAQNLPRDGSMMFTIPFVLYGIFRYLYLIRRKDEGGSPEEILLRDRPILIDVILWGLVSVVILYGSRI